MEKKITINIKVYFVQCPRAPQIYYVFLYMYSMHTAIAIEKFLGQYNEKLCQDILWLRQRCCVQSGLNTVLVYSMDMKRSVRGVVFTLTEPQKKKLLIREALISFYGDVAYMQRGQGFEATLKNFFYFCDSAFTFMYPAFIHMIIQMLQRVFHILRIPVRLRYEKGMKHPVSILKS